MNKKLIILLILLGVFLFVFLNYKKIKRLYYLKNTDNQGTGAIHSSPNPETTVTSKAIQNLQKSLPYSNDIFTISSFDYKLGVFNVDLTEKTSASENYFFNWLKSSEYSSIPQERFLVK